MCPFGKSEVERVSKKLSLDSSKADEARGREDIRKFADRMLEPGMRDKEQKGRKFPKLMVGGGVLKGSAGEGWRGSEKKKSGWWQLARGATSESGGTLLVH